RPNARFALSQYSGFMHRQVQKQVLRLHANYAVLGGEREIDRAPGDVLAHVCGVLELQAEEGEQIAHASGVDLVPGPQLIQDRSRLCIEADMPRPPRLFDLANG